MFVLVLYIYIYIIVVGLYIFGFGHVYLVLLVNICLYRGVAMGVQGVQLLPPMGLPICYF